MCRTARPDRARHRGPAARGAPHLRGSVPVRGGLVTRDPLRVLRAYDSPVAPDPEFATRLRRRMESVITGRLPRPAALPYLTVADARAAMSWYTAAFGAQVQGEPIIMEDNRIGHAELALAGGVLYLA